MKRSEVVRLAYEAGCKSIIVPEEWFRFAKLVAAAEREACAKVCESQRSVIVESHPARVEFDPNDVELLKCALLIRERGAP